MVSEFFAEDVSLDGYIRTKVEATVTPYYLGKLLAQLPSDTQAQTLLAFVRSMREFGEVPWRKQCAYIRQELTDAQLNEVAGVFEEVFADAN